MKRSEMNGVRTVTITDKDARQNRMVLVRDPTGEIWVEVQARHNSTEVFTTLRVGQLWELLPRLASLT